MRPRTETRAQMIRDPLDEPDQQDDPKADGEQRAQEREEDHECHKEHGYDDGGRESPSPKENGSRIASISQLRPSGDVASTASTWATLSREALWKREKADDGDRARDPQLGKLMLYQLSYVRVRLNHSEGETGWKLGSNEGVRATHACSRFAVA